MVRLFDVYYPVRTVILLISEAFVISGSFLAATFLLLGPDSYIALNYENGGYKILALTAITVLFSYYSDLYAPQRLPSKVEVYFRLLTVVGFMAVLLAGIAYVYPSFKIGEDVFLVGLVILSFALVGWRTTYEWLVGHSPFRETVYVLGSGEKAARVAQMIRSRKDLGMEIVGWAGAMGSAAMTREELGEALLGCHRRIPNLNRVIVAIDDRRGKMPVRELLDLRVRGTIIEDAASLIEKTSGTIELDGLHPSALIYSEGFRLNQTMLLARRLVSIAIAGSALLICLPLIPLIALAIKLSSPGPVFFRQKRVGRHGEPFMVLKFRTMRQDAEAATGAVWAGKDDPRVTKVGRFMRKTRLDEIPQLWNVLRGDMSFVGPRPERPEFVQWLNEQIPYYNLRHIIRPGLTGWAQVRYQYGASLEETKQKLQYDLYYIKHMSVALDLLIIFETVKTVLLRRGAQ
jgi:sugar transferase (PEP-CTERM system associated)